MQKVYGKIIEIKENSIIVDPVFGSKIELFFDEEIEFLQTTDENVNVEYKDGEKPKIIQISGLKKAEEPTREVETESMKVPAGQQRKIRGKIIKSGVSQETKIGSVVIELEKLNLEMLYSRISKGEVPEIGSLCTVTILDGKIPKILEITTNNDEELTDPIYSPVTKNLVRWPIACMGCGDTNHEELKHTEGFWSEGFIKKIQPKGPSKGELAREFVLGGAAAVAYKAIKERPGATGFEVYLQIEMYQCKNCFHKKNHYSKFITVDVDPDVFTYEFEFTNPKYEEFFRSYNPDKIVAQSMDR